jgi:adenylate cyclase
MNAVGSTDFAWRKLDRVAVVGRNEPLEIYELLGLRKELPEGVLKIAEKYMQALEHYFRRDFEVALALLAEISESDSPSGVLLKRITELQNLPLGGSWNGVFKATSK